MDLENDPTTLIKMKSGYACLGNTQFLRGYCVLFSDPAVPYLNDLGEAKRADFLSDMALLGDAIIQVCQPFRVNYGLLGNSYPHLHAHLFPRYENEPEHLQQRNVWQYPEEYWESLEHRFDQEKHKDLKNQLITAIKSLM